MALVIDLTTDEDGASSPPPKNPGTKQQNAHAQETNGRTQYPKSDDNFINLISDNEEDLPDCSHGRADGASQPQMARKKNASQSESKIDIEVASDTEVIQPSTEDASITGDVPQPVVSAMPSRPKNHMLRQLAATKEFEAAQVSQRDPEDSSSMGNEKNRGLRTRKRSRSAAFGTHEGRPHSASRSVASPANYMPAGPVAEDANSKSADSENGASETQRMVDDQLMANFVSDQATSTHGVNASASSSGGKTEADPQVVNTYTTISKYLKEVQSDHSTFVKLLLKKQRETQDVSVSGRSDTQPAITEERLNRYVHKHSPFKNLKPAASTTPFQDGLVKFDQIVTNEKGSCVNGNNGQPFKVRYERVSMTDDNVPNYRWHRRQRRNVLAENIKEIIFWPFYVDEVQTMKADSHALEAQFDINIDGRFSRNIARDRGPIYLDYLTAWLEELGCEWHDVLKYFLHLDPKLLFSEIPSAAVSKALQSRTQCSPANLSYEVRQSRLSSRILGSLPPSTHESLSSAALASHAFMSIAKFSLYEVAVWSKPTQVEKTLASSNDRPWEFGEVACQICTLHDCPYHGHFAERAMSSTESADDPESSDASSSPVSRRVRSQSPEDKTVSELNRKVRYLRTGKNNAADFVQLTHHAKINITRAHNITGNPMFIPCNHSGSCEEAHCRCFVNKVHCEKTCGCPDRCRRKYKGCKCHQSKHSCTSSDSCPCMQLNRECDPDLCGMCGAKEILDPVNRHDDALTGNGCKNCSIQRGKFRHLLLASSDVHGFGLFAGEVINRDEFLIEYTGDLISSTEEDRRAAYDIGHETNYLFMLNKNQSVDGTYSGNKARYINNSSTNPNCYAKIKQCNTVARIGLFAHRRINVGDELFFNYHYDEASKKSFVEKSALNTQAGEKQLVTVKEHSKPARVAADPVMAKVRELRDSLHVPDSSELLEPIFDHERNDHSSDENYDSYGTRKRRRQNKVHSNQSTPRKQSSRSIKMAVKNSSTSGSFSNEVAEQASEAPKTMKARKSVQSQATKLMSTNKGPSRSVSATGRVVSKTKEPEALSDVVETRPTDPGDRYERPRKKTKKTYDPPAAEKAAQREYQVSQVAKEKEQSDHSDDENAPTAAEKTAKRVFKASRVARKKVVSEESGSDENLPATVRSFKAQGQARDEGSSNLINRPIVANRLPSKAAQKSAPANQSVSGSDFKGVTRLKAARKNATSTSGSSSGRAGARMARHTAVDESSESRRRRQTEKARAARSAYSAARRAANVDMKDMAIAKAVSGKKDAISESDFGQSESDCDSDSDSDGDVAEESELDEGPIKPGRKSTRATQQNRRFGDD